jgi:hypothetical protein
MVERGASEGVHERVGIFASFVSSAAVLFDDPVGSSLCPYRGSRGIGDHLSAEWAGELDDSKQTQSLGVVESLRGDVSP